MNLSTAVFLINKDLRAVMATYEPGQKSTMFKTLDKSIKAGDMVTVPTNTRHNLTTAKITEVDVSVDFDDQTKVDWIISRIDMETYERTKKMEDQAIEVLKVADFRRRREALSNDLTASAAEIKALPIYKNGSV